LLKKSWFQKSKEAKKEKAKKGRKKKIVPTFQSAKSDMKWRKTYVFVPLPISEKKGTGKTCDFIHAYQPCASEITACNKREIAFSG
jgi:hypothetical protein